MKSEVLLSHSLIFLSFRRKPKQYAATELPGRKIGHETHTHTQTLMTHTHMYDRNTQTHTHDTHTLIIQTHIHTQV